jgi:hypothetical protein
MPKTSKKTALMPLKKKESKQKTLKASLEGKEQKTCVVCKHSLHLHAPEAMPKLWRCQGKGKDGEQCECRLLPLMAKGKDHYSLEARIAKKEKK